MHNCRKSDVEITCVSTSTQTECCEIFDRTWRKGAETRRCFIVHTQLTVMPGSMCCTGTGATMAMGFALQVQFMFRPCSQLVYCLLFIVQPQHSRISTPWPDPPWQWARCCWSRPTGSPSSGCSPCWRPLTSVLCWEWGRSGQHPRVKPPLASQLRRWSLCNKICI